MDGLKLCTFFYRCKLAFCMRDTTIIVTVQLASNISLESAIDQGNPKSKLLRLAVPVEPTNCPKTVCSCGETRMLGLSMDWTELPPSSKGDCEYNSILIIVNRQTEMAIFISLGYAAEIAELPYNELECQSPSGVTDGELQSPLRSCTIAELYSVGTRLSSLSTLAKSRSTTTEMLEYERSYDSTKISRNDSSFREVPLGRGQRKANERLERVDMSLVECI
jgi:hypothetical protein